MTVNELINILNSVEDKDVRVTLDYCGDGAIHIDCIYYEKKGYGKVLALGDYCPPGRTNIITKEKDK